MTCSVAHLLNSVNVRTPDVVAFDQNLKILLNDVAFVHLLNVLGVVQPQLIGGLDDVLVAGFLQRLLHPWQPSLPGAVGTNVMVLDTIRPGGNISRVVLAPHEEELGGGGVHQELVGPVPVEDGHPLLLVTDPGNGDDGVTQDGIVLDPVLQGLPDNEQEITANCETLQLLLGDGGVSSGKETATNDELTRVLAILPPEPSVHRSNFEVSRVHSSYQLQLTVSSIHGDHSSAELYSSDVVQLPKVFDPLLSDLHTDLLVPGDGGLDNVPQILLHTGDEGGKFAQRIPE